MKIVAVFHGSKVDGIGGGHPIQTRVNSTLTIEGMSTVLNLVPAIKALGPFSAMYSSRLARALDTASVLANELDLDFKTIRGLGQMASKNGSEIVYYPGHEDENPTYWQSRGVRALEEIVGLHEDENAKVLVVSHRPVIGGIVAHIRGIHDEVTLSTFVNDPKLTEKGFVVIEDTLGKPLQILN